MGLHECAHPIFYGTRVLDNGAPRPEAQRLAR
jgi:hypothetical protein